MSFYHITFTFFLSSIKEENKSNEENYGIFVAVNLSFYPEVSDEVTSVSWDVFIELLPAKTPREELAVANFVS